MWRIKLKIFYSWQSDTPAEIGKDFIGQALRLAVDELNELHVITDADRPIEVDQDTQGITGDPVIASTIFAKISDADLFVVDVTLTQRTEANKKGINSNVAYELGYAHSSLSDTKILKIMNTSNGGPSKLPFDLRHRRWPIQYSANPETGEDQLQIKINELKDTIKSVLTEHMSSPSGISSPDPFPMHQPTHNRAFFWSSNEELIGDIKEVKQYAGARAFYLRMIPAVSIKKPRLSEIKNDPNFYNFFSPLGNAMSVNVARNKLGLMTYKVDGINLIMELTQIFKSGEIWGVNSSYLKKRADYDFPFIPSTTFEEAIRKSLKKYASAMKDIIGYDGDVIVEAGIVSVEGSFIAMPRKYFDSMWGPILDNEIVLQKRITLTDQSLDRFALEFFEEVFEASGEARPKGYQGFPKV